MKLFVFSALVAVAMAKPQFLVPSFYAAAPPGVPVAVNTIATAPITSQYHSQDALGQYEYGYSSGLSAKSEIKTLDGMTRGSYSYLDAEGKLQSVQYTADAVNGFRATASNMPVAPVETRTAPIETRTAPLPVQETPEVAKARADFMVAFEEAKTRAAAEPEQLMEKRMDMEKKAEEPVVLAKTAQETPASIAAFPSAPLLRSDFETRPFGFHYAYSAPTYGYSAYPYQFGYPAFNYGFRSAFPIAAQYTAPIAAPEFIPQPVAETPEVARARAEHLAAHAKARAGM